MEKIQLLESVLGQSHKANRDYHQFHCPFCNHRKPKLGISIGTGGWKCWVCPSKGRSIVGLFKKVGAKPEQIKIASELWKTKQEFHRNENVQVLTLPKEYLPLWIDDKKNPFFNKAKNYVLGRGLTEKDIKKHRIGYCYLGQYNDMIIMPSYAANGMLNFFTARSYINKTFTIPKEIDKNKIIFDENLINWNEPIIIVESKLDAITIKRNAIPLNGKQMTKELAKRILIERPPKLIFCLDGDALKDCFRLGEYFKNNGIEVYQVNLPFEHDANSLGFEKTWELISKAEPMSEINLFKFKILEKLKR